MATKQSLAVMRTQRRRIALVQEYKASVGCECGERDSRALELHHLDPNTKHSSLRPKYAKDGRRRAGGVKWGDLSYDEIVEEIRKCKVLCSNCHKKETWNPPLPAVREKHSPNEARAREALGLPHQPQER